MRLYLLLVATMLATACSDSSTTATEAVDTVTTNQPFSQKCLAAAEPIASEHWVTSWMTAPTDALISRPLVGQTERQFVAPHWNGDVVRLRLQNRFGSTAVTLSNVQLAKQDVDASLIADSNCSLTFSGLDSVTIQAGESVASDPIYFQVRAFEKVAVDFYVPGIIAQPSRHLDAREIPYTSIPGNYSGQTDGSAFLASEASLPNNWLLLEGLDVIAAQHVGVVVALGDSITDGADSLFNTVSLSNRPPNTTLDQRYPDYLARRLLAAGKDLSVGNAGISGNELIGQGLLPQYGPGVLDRYPTDVLAVPGVTDVLIMIGTNDFGNGVLTSTSAEQLINGYTQLITDLQANGLNVVMGTIPPAKGFPIDVLGVIGGVMHGSSEAIAKRAEVNQWIRTSGVADGVVDFAACLQDGTDPEKMNPDYDSGDHLHPNAEGYAAMADCVDLNVFSR